jgi:hypothetical protein
MRAINKLDIKDVSRVLAAARCLILSGVEELLSDATSELEHFDGLPVRMNLLRLLGHEESETTYTRILSWLMDPVGSHGLGDSVLRGVLAIVGDPQLRSLAGGSEDIGACVVGEVPVGTGYIDVVAVVKGAILAIEAKIWAAESKKKYGTRSVGQTTYYRLHLLDPEECSRSLKAMGSRAERLAGPRPRVVTAFLRPAGGPDAKHPNGEANPHRSMSWLQVERVVGVAMARGNADPDVRGLLMSFRSSIIERTGARIAPINDIRALRSWLDHPSLRRGDPVAAFARLSSVKTAWSSEET